MMNHLYEIRMVYGLIFFTLGFAILLQPRRGSVYYLASALTWLAGFALIHAFADWGLVFTPNEGEAAPETIAIMLRIRTVGVIISFGLLMQFGLALLGEHHRWRVLTPLLPIVVVGTLLGVMALDSMSPDDPPIFLADTRVTGRYFLGLPSALLAAWGLLTQVPVLKRDRLGRHVGNLYGAAACFVLYGMVGGLVVPARDFFPANLINETAFFRFAQMPVEAARALAFFGITVFIVRLLGIFQEETQRRLQAVERDRALLQERELIARELHDGVMQTLYGTGLGLKQMINLASTNCSPAGEILQTLNREIGRSIVRMRTFVLDLKEAVITGAELAEAVRAQAGEIGQFAGLRVVVQAEIGHDLRIPGGVREEVLAVIREGLSNVVRHAEASEAQVVVSVEDGVALVRITDDGKGFEVAGAATHGLAALRDRIEALGGYMQVLSVVGQGTHLVAHLPVRSERVWQEGEEQGA